MLADYLTRRGIVVLRVDDRGVGGSTGSIATSTTADFATDSVAGSGFLKTLAKVDSDRVGLIGHSEGAVVALAHSGLVGEELLYLQTRATSRMLPGGDEISALNVRLQRRIFEVIKDTPGNAEANRKIQQVVENDIDEISAGHPPEMIAAIKQSTAAVEPHAAPYSTAVKSGAVVVFIKAR